MLSQSLLVKAARCEDVIRPPVWFMRQAGRYMKEYQTIRRNHTFPEMYKTPEIARDITLQPVHVIGVDAAILFSDILVVPEAMGMTLEFVDGKGPMFPNPVRSAPDVKRLVSDGSADKLEFVYEAIKLVKKDLGDIPLIGFAGAPFTVASYMVEGGGTKSFKEIKKLLFKNPDLADRLLEKITKVTIDYLNHQIKSGVDTIQIFDSWANALAWNEFSRFSLKYIQKVIQGLNNPEHVPVIVFCKGSSVFAPLLENVGADVISLDWNCDMRDMRDKIREDIALQGNLDPMLLYAPVETIRKHVQTWLKGMEGQRGFIVNLGHGILPDIPVESVKCVVDTVKEFEICRKST